EGDYAPSPARAFHISDTTSGWSPPAAVPRHSRQASPPPIPARCPPRTTRSHRGPPSPSPFADESVPSTDRNHSGVRAQSHRWVASCSQPLPFPSTAATCVALLGRALDHLGLCLV